MAPLFSIHPVTARGYPYTECYHGRKYPSDCPQRILVMCEKVSTEVAVSPLLSRLQMRQRVVTEALLEGRFQVDEALSESSNPTQPD